MSYDNGMGMYVGEGEMREMRCKRAGRGDACEL